MKTFALILFLMTTATMALGTVSSAGGRLGSFGPITCYLDEQGLDFNIDRLIIDAPTIRTITQNNVVPGIYWKMTYEISSTDGCSEKVDELMVYRSDLIGDGVKGGFSSYIYPNVRMAVSTLKFEGLRQDGLVSATLHGSWGFRCGGERYVAQSVQMKCIVK